MLAAMLLPALQMAKAQANRISCMSNMRQFGLCIISYASDYQNRPPDYQPGPPWNLNLNPAFLDDYVKKWEILYCPASAGEVNLLGMTYGARAPDLFSRSYFYYQPGDCDVWTGFGCTIKHSAVTLDSFSSVYLADPGPHRYPPEKMALIHDETYVGIPSGPRFYNHTVHGSCYGDSADGGAMLLGSHHWYCDGHVAWHPRNELVLAGYGGFGLWQYFRMGDPFTY